MTNQALDPKPLTLSKTDMDQRLVELKKAHAEVMANLNAIAGAIQQVEFFITELANREVAAKQKTDEPKLKEVPGIVEKK